MARLSFSQSNLFYWPDNFIPCSMFQSVSFPKLSNFYSFYIFQFTEYVLFNTNYKKWRKYFLLLSHLPVWWRVPYSELRASSPSLSCFICACLTVLVGPSTHREWLERQSTDSANKRHFFLFTSDRYNFVSLRLKLEEASEGGMVNFMCQLDWAMGYPGIW